MACIDADGALTPTGLLMLKGLAEEPQPPEEIARIVSEPLFRVRGSLRELVAADLIVEEGGLFMLTDEGRGRL